MIGFLCGASFVACLLGITWWIKTDGDSWGSIITTIAGIVVIWLTLFYLIIRDCDEHPNIQTVESSTYMADSITIDTVNYSKDSFMIIVHQYNLKKIK